MLWGRSHRRSWFLDAALILLAGCVLVLPLFRLEYLNNWPSIEATFIADGRLLQANWPHHLWQPLWYTGTRANYVYPPGLSSCVAVLSATLGIAPAHAYHIAIALFYALGVSAVYLWTRTATGSRKAGWLAAIAVALVSPMLFVLRDLRWDSGFFVPWRLHVLVKYGEGPHISSLSILPLVWLGALRRFQGGSVHWILLSASAAALVVTLNFYGLTALAITFPLLVWSCFLQRRSWHILRDAVSITVLAYGLTAWWLVPSFLQITGRNLRLVAPKGNNWSLPVFVFLLFLYFASSLVARRSARFSGYGWFIWSGLYFLAIYVLGFRWYGLQIAGDSNRLMPELDLFVIFCSVQLAGLLWNWRPHRFPLIPKAVVLTLLTVVFFPSWRYLRHVYFDFPEDKHWQERIEFRTASWLQEKFPNQRVVVTGTNRFWYNVWHDREQADGGSQQGILNPLLPTAQWRITRQDDPKLALLWLQALAVDILVISGPNSQEPYKDVQQQMPMYDSMLPVLRDDGEGNRYYRIPRRTPGIVRVVDRAKVQGTPAVPGESEDGPLGAYVDAIEAIPPGGPSAERAQGKWHGSDALGIETELKAGESLLITESYDPYWRAYRNGRPEEIQRDSAGFMLLHLPPGRHSVRMIFETPLEMSIGRATSGLCLALMAWLAYRAKPRLPEDRHTGV